MFDRAMVNGMVILTEWHNSLLAHFFLENIDVRLLMLRSVYENPR